MRKRSHDERDVFPNVFALPELASMIVGFLPLEQWSEWIWTMRQEKQYVPMFSRVLRWRRVLDNYTWNRALCANDIDLLCQVQIPRNIALVRDSMKLIKDIELGPEPTVRFLLNHVTPTVYQNSFLQYCTTTSRNADEMKWKLPLLMQLVPDNVFRYGFIQACISNNVAIAKMLWHSKRLTTHHFVFNELSLHTSKEIFVFLFELGIDENDVETMREHFRNTTMFFARMRYDVNVFALLQHVGIIRKEDCKKYFEEAFSANNVPTMRYFYAFFETFESPVQFTWNNGIESSECVDILLARVNLCPNDAYSVVSKIRRCIFARAIDVVECVLKKCVEDKEQTCEFLKRNTLISWRVGNVVLLNWIWDRFWSQTRLMFEYCFSKLLHFCNDSDMLSFLILHQENNPHQISKQRQELVGRTVHNQDPNMFALMLKHGFITERDFVKDAPFGSLLRCACARNVNFLRLVWKSTEFWEQNMHQRLIRLAIRFESGNVFDFLIEKKPQFNMYAVEDLPFICFHGMHSLLNSTFAGQLELLDDEQRTTLERCAYTSISKTNTLLTIEALWKILPISKQTFAEDDCSIFWRICHKHIDSGVFLWHKHLASSEDIFASPPFDDITHQFLAAIHFDI